MMMTQEIKTIGVVGSGQMGAGIAQVAAASGFSVVLQDLAEGPLNRARQGIDMSLEKFVAKQKITPEEREATFNRIHFTRAIEGLINCDLIIEAIIENEAIKFELFKTLDDLTGPHTILATNTSSISITRIAGQTSRPEKVIGMHFMNPVPLMQLVEIIEGLATSAETRATVEAVATQMGKTCVLAQDYPGFIVNRILMPMINEAVFALMEGVGSAADIDAAMKLGTNQPMGPLTLADFIGLDTCLAILNVLHENLGDPKYRPCPLLRKYVDAGWLGRKVGRGFYSY
jgi:3-hydroxybutyryl-CoA dehydrogenase